jgi:hypothetical protein
VLKNILQLLESYVGVLLWLFEYTLFCLATYTYVHEIHAFKTINKDLHTIDNEEIIVPEEEISLPQHSCVPHSHICKHSTNTSFFPIVKPVIDLQICIIIYSLDLLKCFTYGSTSKFLKESCIIPINLSSLPPIFRIAKDLLSFHM